MKLRSKVRNLWSKIESWLRREWFGIKPISSWIVPLMMNLWSKINSWLIQAWSWIAENRLIVIVVILFISGLVLFVHFLFINILGLYYILFYLGLQGDKPAYIIGSLWGFAAFLYGLHLRNNQLAAFKEQLEQGNEQIDNFKEQLEQGNKQLAAFEEQLKQGHAQLEQDREHNLEDRFIRSVELMGNTELGIRLGGLAGLEALLNTNTEMYERVLEYLGGILREPLELKGWVTTHNQQDVIPYCRKKEEGESGEWRKTDQKLITRPDIAYIIKMLKAEEN